MNPGEFLHCCLCVWKSDTCIPISLFKNNQFCLECFILRLPSSYKKQVYSKNMRKRKDPWNPRPEPDWRSNLAASPQEYTPHPGICWNPILVRPVCGAWWRSRSVFPEPSTRNWWPQLLRCPNTFWTSQANSKAPCRADILKKQGWGSLHLKESKTNLPRILLASNSAHIKEIKLL